MVNPDSDLARAHPDWVLPGPAGPAAARAWRHQQVARPGQPRRLGLPPRPAATRCSPSTTSTSSSGTTTATCIEAAATTAGPAVHAQTLAVYRLLDELRARHPGLEIECCASGGGAGRPRHPGPHRPGLGQRLQRRPGAPAHPALDRAAAAARAGRQPRRPAVAPTPPAARHDLGFRAATALFGHFGIEWDIASAAERGAAGPGRGDRLYKAAAAAAARRPGGPRRPPRPGRLPARGGGRRPRPRRCSPTCS